MIATIPREIPFWQDLARCDYFRTSVKFVEADIYMVVGEITGFVSVKELVQHGNHREKLIDSDKLFNTVTLKSICHGCQV